MGKEKQVGKWGQHGEVMGLEGEYYSISIVVKEKGQLCNLQSKGVPRHLAET